MRTRITKNAMGLNDSPTTMDVSQKNPPADKYETGNPESWNEGVNMDHPWDSEKREETGHPKLKANTYASMVHEAKELEAKALRCLKLAETIFPDAGADVIERQAVDFMTMSNKSVLSTLRRMREFDEVVSEARVAKIVDAVMEVMAEEKEEEKKEEEKEVKAEKEEVKEEEKKEVEAKKEEEEEDAKIASIVEAVLLALAEDKDHEKSETKEEEKKEEEKEAKKAEKEEEKEEEKKEVEAAKECEEEEEEKEAKKSALDVSFDEIGDVMASHEDVALLAQLFTAKEEMEEKEEKEEKKEAKIKTLKNITASKEDEIDKLSSLWFKE